MGLETAPQNPLGRIDPSSLIGRPEAVVTPQAVEALSNAVRQGFITAEDIRARVKQNPATEAKQKAEIQLASEFTSPEAVARRKQEAELKEAQLTFGTNLQAFQALAPEAGIAQPMTEDGRPDYAKMAELGAKLAARKSKQQIALEHLTAVGAPLTAHQNGQVVSFHTNKFGEVIDDDLKARYAKDMSPFSDLAPGQAAAPVAPVAPAAVTSPPPELQVMPKNQAEAIQRDAEIQKFLPVQVQSKQSAKPMVTPISATPIGKSIPGGGVNLGTSPAAEKPYTEVQGRALIALNRAAASNKVLSDLERNPEFDPTSIASQARMAAYKAGTVGQVASQITGMTADERNFVSSAASWMQGLLRLESGAAISTKEQAWYERTFFPVVGDDKSVQANKSQARKAVETAMEQVISGKMTPQQYEQLRDQVSGPAATTAPTPGASGPVVTLSTGRRVQRGPDGQYYDVP